jgi:hypothetical protein
MHVRLLLVLMLVITTQSWGQSLPPHISQYRVSFGSITRNRQTLLILRRFELNGKPYYLLVDPQTLQTTIAPDQPTSPTVLTMADLLTFQVTSPYSKALSAAASNAKPLQDAGFTHMLPREKGITLTIDLCPSHKPLDRVIFTSLAQELGKYESPVPLALSITGVWMKQHPDDLAWLKQLANKGILLITWINHSFHHHVSTTEPLDRNFLLEPGTDLNDEVLLTEQAMLTNGLIPSVFFRFPGLISDQNLVNRIGQYSLITVGSDAWLAKGQTPSWGSIVLIHGNGNEPVGVEDFLKLLRQHQADIANRQWLLYDLRRE